jgi:dTDP-4-dehydrorhamnose 3,5-epimerase-like enzyme
MSKRDKNLWGGVNEAAQAKLTSRDYKVKSFAQRVTETGVEARELTTLDLGKPDAKKVWIPGVEIFSRQVHPQRHRGIFGELARRDEGILAKIGFWPKQWATARMFGGSAKGFHIHPPSIPSGMTAQKWLQRLFVTEPGKYSLRRYDEEQWDVMFFVQGKSEMILHDVRAGLPTRTMRFFVDGDNHRGPNNVGVVVPPGVAHAIRVEGSEDVIMVYGTSVMFNPEFEGRIASEIETATLPQEWNTFLGRGD